MDVEEHEDVQQYGEKGCGGKKQLLELLIPRDS